MKFTLTKVMLLVAVVLGLAVQPSQAQNRTRFAGRYNAIDYAYGIVPGMANLQVAVGNTSTGTASITLVTACTVAGDGTNVCPLATNAPILVGTGSTQDSITPTAVSNCSFPSAAYGSCTITASFTYTHGTGETITTGSLGLQEAINLANAGTGGVVVVDRGWAALGGTNAKITAAAPFSNVPIEDTRVGEQYWSMQPSTLTVIQPPAVQTTSTTAAGGTNFTATPVGTWGTSAYYFCITYVDALGGESGCSASYTQTPGTTAYSLNTISPIASAGAVGWRQYGGITSTPLAYLLPITSANCTLTTLESVMPACAIGSNGVWPAIYVSTTSQSPVAQSVTNVNNPVPQSHTTFAYAPTSASNLFPFQTNFGPFSTTTMASATAGDVNIIGSFNLPAGFQNVIGRTIRVSGKLILTAGASSTLSVQLMTGWAGGLTAGLPLAVCNAVSGFVFATQPYTDVNFSCTMTTNAVGATAIGSIQPESSFIASYAAGTLIPIGADASNAAVASLGLFAQNTYSVSITPSVAADTTVRLLSLHIEVLE